MIWLAQMIHPRNALRLDLEELMELRKMNAYCFTVPVRQLLQMRIMTYTHLRARLTLQYLQVSAPICNHLVPSSRQEINAVLSKIDHHALSRRTKLTLSSQKCVQYSIAQQTVPKGFQ